MITESSCATPRTEHAMSTALLVDDEEFDPTMNSFAETFISSLSSGFIFSTAWDMVHSKTSGNSLTKSGLIWELHSFKVFWIQSRSSSLCVDGHFFRRRPQLSRFPVCRCRVLARARSAPAARLSVPMAAAAGGDRVAPEPRRDGERAGRRAGEWADGCLAGRGGAPGPRGEREAADSARPQPGVRSGPRRPGGDGEAVPEGGKEGREAPARTVAAASAAATAAAAETRELFPGRQ